MQLHEILTIANAFFVLVAIFGFLTGAFWNHLAPKEIYRWLIVVALAVVTVVIAGNLQLNQNIALIFFVGAHIIGFVPRIFLRKKSVK